VVTVLGASGFVGSAVVAALAGDPVVIRAVARRPCAVTSRGRAAIEVRTADLTVAEEVRAAVAGSDAVVHLLLPVAGWRADGAEAERVNVGVMRDLIRCVRTSGQPARREPPVVVFAGSVSQAGPVSRLPIDGSEPDRPEGAYDL
jgi:nucleoside-diphosphate-sugar epimerase